MVVPLQQFRLKMKILKFLGIQPSYKIMMTVYIFTVVIMNVDGDLGVMMGVKSLVVLQNMITLILTAYTILVMTL